MDSATRKERIQELATSLAIQFNALFPEGYSNDDADHRAQVQTCFQTLVTTSDHDFDELKEAMPKAVEEWKMLQQNTSSTSTSKAPSIFSFLDQFGTGGGFVMVDIQDIVETTSLSRRLEKLKQVQYLEDILSDWNDVREMLREGLRYAGATHEDSALVAKEYLGLHRKWFHDGRESTEYLTVQYHLCCNLSECIQEQIQRPTPAIDDNIARQQQWLLDLLINWHDMFLDLMQRDQYDKGAISEMESTYVIVLSSTDEVAGVQPLQILALVDPRASGFGSWVHFLSPLDVVELISRGNILSIMWQRAVAEDESSHITEQQQKLHRTLRWYSLSVLTYILMQIRVSLFPWNLIDCDTECGGNAEETARCQLVNRYLQLLRSAGDPHIEWQRELCYSG